MKRRAFITAATGLLAATAGCVGGEPSTPDGGSGGTPTSTPASPSISSRALEPREECVSPDDAAISTDGTTVVVEGCIVGKNGCMVAALASATYDADADELAVRVVTEDDSEPDEACTQQLVNRGYRVTVAFDGALPGTTVVTHDGVEGEQEVARAETGE